MLMVYAISEDQEVRVSSTSSHCPRITYLPCWLKPVPHFHYSKIQTESAALSRHITIFQEETKDR